MHRHQFPRLPVSNIQISSYILFLKPLFRKPLQAQLLFRVSTVRNEISCFLSGNIFFHEGDRSHFISKFFDKSIHRVINENNKIYTQNNYIYKGNLLEFYIKIKKKKTNKSDNVWLKSDRHSSEPRKAYYIYIKEKVTLFSYK